MAPFLPWPSQPSGPALNPHNPNARLALLSLALTLYICPFALLGTVYLSSYTAAFTRSHWSCRLFRCCFPCCAPRARRRHPTAFDDEEEDEDCGCGCCGGWMRGVIRPLLCFLAALLLWPLLLGWWLARVMARVLVPDFCRGWRVVRVWPPPPEPPNPHDPHNPHNPHNPHSPNNHNNHNTHNTNSRARSGSGYWDSFEVASASAAAREERLRTLGLPPGYAWVAVDPASESADVAAWAAGEDYGTMVARPRVWGDGEPAWKGIWWHRHR